MHKFTAPVMEFHIARTARDKYQFNQTLFALSGNALIADFHAARLFAQAMNAKRELLHYPEQAVQAGHINAMGLMDEIFHMVVRKYKETVNSQILQQAYDDIAEKIGTSELDKVLTRFAHDFPPIAVYNQNSKPEDYVKGNSGGVSHRYMLLEELIMLWLSNNNPAYSRYSELFELGSMSKVTKYHEVMDELQLFFKSHPPMEGEQLDLIELLLQPIKRYPHSIEAQLEHMLKIWKPLLGKYYLLLLSGLDMISEENKPIFHGPGPSEVYNFSEIDEEPEAYSPDQDWMPRCVLIAKNTYVWLDQLSRHYGTKINRLDQIPDKELEILGQRGFTGLWLIGVWERSPASKTIKQLCGNPEALASAYSLSEYRVAEDLGGEDALNNLKERAWHFGIRMASDMVPNHMGIDSDWVMNHPERFMTVQQSPFPVYSFNGPDLSTRPDITVQVEDHYFDRTDAAVIFRRINNNTGETRYIYHGNDGTDMPWNDTAQLDYLKSEVREAVIQEILSVARQFPIIRFDAAMTLAKRHFQRLWYPEPGTAGAIASRAEHSMSKEEFNQYVPVEFWREVVDRIAEEVPDTLLLAEAFWLMEGFFVRTLGMHRVYNSSFMNMLRDEDNAKYRTVMKNTIDFDLQILKRFVNFMNNPDEKTAVEQFGKSDKYFGICVMMSTLPGLPMFGHGQIEGFEEKYGMEYRKAYRDETPDEYFIEHHNRVVFPLLHRRYLFAEVENFVLYDFTSPDGSVNEDIMAYSNRFGNEKALVIYHNRSTETQGSIRNSVGMKETDSQGKTIGTRIVNFADALEISPGPGKFCIFRDQISGLQFIRQSTELVQQGYACNLGPYECRVLLDFQEVTDNEWLQYSAIERFLNGRGAPDLDEVRSEIFLQPLHIPFMELLDLEVLEKCELKFACTEKTSGQEILKTLNKKILFFLKACAEMNGTNGQLELILSLAQTRVTSMSEFFLGCKADQIISDDMIETVRARFTNDKWNWLVLLGWLAVNDLGRFTDVDDLEQRTASRFLEWQLARRMRDAVNRAGMDDIAASKAVGLLRQLLLLQNIEVQDLEDEKSMRKLLETAFSDPDLQHFLGINRHKGVLWFNLEAFVSFMRWLFIIKAVMIRASSPPSEQSKKIQIFRVGLNRLIKAAEASGYRVDRLLKDPFPVC